MFDCATRHILNHLYVILPVVRLATTSETSPVSNIQRLRCTVQGPRSWEHTADKAVPAARSSLPSPIFSKDILGSVLEAHLNSRGHSAEQELNQGLQQLEAASLHSCSCKRPSFRRPPGSTLHLPGRRHRVPSFEGQLCSAPHASSVASQRPGASKHAISALQVPCLYGAGPGHYKETSSCLGNPSQRNRRAGRPWGDQNSLCHLGNLR